MLWTRKAGWDEGLVSFVGRSDEENINKHFALRDPPDADMHNSDGSFYHWARVEFAKTNRPLFSQYPIPCAYCCCWAILNLADL